ncbi:MAG: hypothetical protein WCI72_01175 [archaeon]
MANEEGNVEVSEERKESFSEKAKAIALFALPVAGVALGVANCAYSFGVGAYSGYMSSNGNPVDVSTLTSPSYIAGAVLGFYNGFWISSETGRKSNTLEHIFSGALASGIGLGAISLCNFLGTSAGAGIGRLTS